MTRRETLAAATAALAACPATAKILASAQPLGVADPPAAPQTGPMVDQLINLAERGSDPEYYGRLLTICLEQTGTVAKDNGDGTISLYSPDHGAWRKRTVRSSGRPIPADLLMHIKPANRGMDFPGRVPFRII
jgi:hypothetical protein